MIVNGLGFEGWMPRLVAASGYRGPVVIASEGISARVTRGISDPHVWQDLVNGRRMENNIGHALSRAAPDAADAIDRRCTDYTAALVTLDRSIRDQFDRISRERRRIVTSHDAFGYLGAAYGIDVLAPLPASSESEPSAARVSRLITQLGRREVRAVFMENMIDPRLLDRMAHDAGVTIGGKLYSDALSGPGGDASTYMALIAHNATTILSALSQR